MTPSEELAPCPFCGSAEVSISYSATMQSPEPAARFVECEACAAMGPSHEIQGDAPDRDEYTQSKAIAAWNTRQSADLIESMSDVERIRREAFEEAAKVAEKFLEAQSPPDIGANSRTKSIALAIRSLSPRPDPRQDEEGVTQADLKAASEYAQFRVDNEHELAKAFAAHRRASMSPDPVRQDEVGAVTKLRQIAALSDYPDHMTIRAACLLGEYALTFGDLRAAIASMRQVAMQLREALLELASEVGAAAMPAASLDRISGPLRKARSALASADAVMGEGE